MSILLFSMVLDYFIGDPMTWPHPVIYIGKLISRLEKPFIKRPRKKLFGFIMVILVLTAIYFVTEVLSRLALLNQYIYIVFLAYGLYAAIAYRALIKASNEVYQALGNKGVEEARVKLSYIVGRDTKSLSEEQIIKATVETVAENTIDGTIAPIFYAVLGYFLCGKPLHFIWIYKGINTMDSMVGYMNDKYRDYGFAAAKLDDIANFIPARLGGVLMLISNGVFLDGKNGMKIFLRDRLNHKSPNSAHGESVVAGLLNIRLGGNSSYFGKVVEKPDIGDENQSLDRSHIKETEKILTRTYVLIFIIIGICEGIRLWYGL